MARVLVVDDDPSLLKALRLGLGALGHEVLVASRGQQGLGLVAAEAPDVVVLDLGLPDVDGLEVCRRIREWSEVPILVLSANDAEGRKVAALDGGADDYVTKPFSMAELEARIRAALRHRRLDPAESEASTLSYGPVELDLVHHGATVSGTELEPTQKEFDVLAFLVRHAGKVCTHQMILQAVWGVGYATEAQYLHAYIHRLRHKLEPFREVAVRTASGIGYELVSTMPESTDRCTGGAMP